MVEGSNQETAQGIFRRCAIQSRVLNFNGKGSPSQVERVLLTHVCAILGMKLLSCMLTPGFHSSAFNPGMLHMKISAHIKIIHRLKAFSEILFLKMVVEDGACHSVSSEFLLVPIEIPILILGMSSDTSYGVVCFQMVELCMLQSVCVL